MYISGLISTALRVESGRHRQSPLNKTSQPPTAYPSYPQHTPATCSLHSLSIATTTVAVTQEQSTTERRHTCTPPWYTAQHLWGNELPFDQVSGNLSQVQPLQYMETELAKLPGLSWGHCMTCKTPPGAPTCMPRAVRQNLRG